MLKIASTFIITILFVTPVSAQCAGNDFLCQHNQRHNQAHQAFNGNDLGQFMAGVQRQPGLIDFFFTNRRAQEEHDLKMKIMREHLKRLQRGKPKNGS